MSPFVSIWTADDTSEAGPTVDEKGATVAVETYEKHATLHVVTDDESAGLWTVVATLDEIDVRKLIGELRLAAKTLRRAGARQNLSKENKS